MYHNLDSEQIKVIKKALETCSYGDVPDWAVGILSSLHMDGWELVKRK